MDAQLSQVLFLKIAVEVTLPLLTLKESSLSMKLCHLEVSWVEDSPNSVLDYLKDLDGSSLTIPMLNHSPLVKVKAVHLLQVPAAALVLNSKNSVLEAREAVLQLPEVVVLAKVIPFQMVADTTSQRKTMTVKMTMELITQDSLA